MRISLLIAVMLWKVQFGVGQQKQLMPRDETHLDSSLAVFVGDLKTAIKSKDESWIYSVLDDMVVSTFGDQEGIESFKKHWNPGNDTTVFWSGLERIVNMGGVFLHDTADQSGRYSFVFPYAYDLELNEEDDYYFIGVITGKNVNLRAAPDIKSDIITQLTYHVIHYLPPDKPEHSMDGDHQGAEPEWYQISTDDGKYTGWVHQQYVYALFGPRLFLFKDEMDRWRISAFVTGD